MDPISRKVVCLIATHDTDNWLRLWAQQQGFNLNTDYDGNPRPSDSFDFHVTLVCSANEVAVPETQHVISPITLQATGYDVLGADRRVPVMKLAATPHLLVMREFFVATYGIEPTFADYKPHVSMSYAWGGEPALDELALPDLALTFDQLRVKTLGGQKTAKSKPPLLAKRAPGAHAVYG